MSDMEEKIDWKNAKYNPKRTLGGKTEEQSINEFTKYCRENLSAVEATLTSSDYDKTLTLLDNFGITDIAVANRVLTACKADLAASERRKQEASPEQPLVDISLPKEPSQQEIPHPKVTKHHKAAHITKQEMDYSEEMSELKQLEEDFLGRRL